MFVYYRSPAVTRGTTAIAVARFFLFVLIAIAGSLAIWHWWNASSTHGDLAFTQMAAKDTYTLFAREVVTASSCPPEDDCSVTSAVQTYNGTLYAYYDTSVAIGSSAAACITVGGLGNPDVGIHQQCTTVYTFTGDGNVTAGTIIAETVILSQPDEEGSYMQTLLPIVGGTGPYKAASGGVISMTTNPIATDQRDLAFADVLMVTT